MAIVANTIWKVIKSLTLRRIINHMDTKEQKIEIKKTLIPLLLLLITSTAILLTFIPKSRENFYSKLIKGEKVNILIAGDSISAPSEEESWSMQLKRSLENKYGCKVSLDNISMGGTSSYEGYARIKMLSNSTGYDLCIVCYGQNDSEENFSMYYESIYRALKDKYSECSIISILESAQREYTPKMKKIIELAEYYQVPVADTIKAFNESGYTHEELTEDGTHLNTKGYDIYHDILLSIIDEQVYSEKNKITVANDKKIIKEPLNPTVEEFANAVCIERNKFQRIDDYTYIVALKEPVIGKMGIHYYYQSGTNRIKIESDNKEVKTVEFEHTPVFQQEHVHFIPEVIKFNNEVKLTFLTVEQAETFQGICISY